MAGKCIISVLAENAFFGFGRKCGFTGLTEKCVFMKICVLHFLRKNAFCGFGGKVCFSVFAGKCIFGSGGKMYLQENRIYGLKIIFDFKKSFLSFIILD